MTRTYDLDVGSNVDMCLTHRKTLRTQQQCIFSSPGYLPLKLICNSPEHKPLVADFLQMHGPLYLLPNATDGSCSSSGTSPRT